MVASTNTCLILRGRAGLEIAGKVMNFGARLSEAEFWLCGFVYVLAEPRLPFGISVLLLVKWR